MDAHPDAGFLRRGNHLTEETGQILAQALPGHSTIALQHPAQAGDVVAIEGARQARHDVAEQLPPVGFRGAVEPGSRARHELGRVLVLRAGAFEHEAVEGRELVRVEPQSAAPARQRRLEVGAGPVEDRHEIVADGGHATGAEVTE